MKPANPIAWRARKERRAASRVDRIFADLLQESRATFDLHCEVTMQLKQPEQSIPKVADPSRSDRELFEPLRKFLAIAPRLSAREYLDET